MKIVRPTAIPPVITPMAAMLDFLVNLFFISDISLRFMDSRSCQKPDTVHGNNISGLSEAFYRETLPAKNRKEIIFCPSESSSQERQADKLR